MSNPQSLYSPDIEISGQDSSRLASHHQSQSPVLTEVDVCYGINHSSQPADHISSAEEDSSRSSFSLACHPMSQSPFTIPLSLRQLHRVRHDLDSSADILPDRSDLVVGVKCISSGHEHTLFLTYSGEVYVWGDNYCGEVLYHGLEAIKSPIKIPLTNVISISAGFNHSLAISSEGKLYGWGWNRFNQINMSSSIFLPITLISIPFNIKETYNGACFSLALTQEGQVVKWGYGKSFELIEDLNDIVFLYVDGNSFIAIDSIGNFFYYSGRRFTKIPVTQFLTPRTPFKGSVSLVRDIRKIGYLLVINTNGDVWQFNNVSNKDSFNTKPIKVKGLTNIVSINCYRGIYATINVDGNVFVWGSLSRISDFYEDCDEPICLEAFTNIEGISVGENFLFAYNKNTVWAWGRNDKGQLGTGDLIDRPQPVKVFGSELLGSFQYPKQPVDRMFSGLIKLIYFEYLQYSATVFLDPSYVKARFFTKCSISKRVVKFAKELFNAHRIFNIMFLNNPQDLNLSQNICNLQLRLSTGYHGSKVINTRIKILDVFYDEVDYDPQLLSFFPNVEVVRVARRSGPFRQSIDLTHLSNLKSLDLDYPFIVEQLPTSLVKLVLQYVHNVYDLGYLTSLKELVVSCDRVSKRLLSGEIGLPPSIVRLEAWFISRVNVEIQLPNLKELIIHYSVPTNVIEENFPSLKAIQMVEPDQQTLSNSPLSPTKVIHQGLIKSVKLIKNEYLVELSCFPWWIQYPITKYLLDFFGDFVKGSLL
ncbi:hypothetical protein P9112_013498 [Eukaryota sp. TZLM1-RC]